jgi:hypothetical protein
MHNSCTAGLVRCREARHPLSDILLQLGIVRISPRPVTVKSQGCRSVCFLHRVHTSHSCAWWAPLAYSMAHSLENQAMQGI